MQTKTKKFLLTILQILISVSLLYFIFRHIDIKQTLQIFKTINYFYLLFGFITFVIFLQLLFVLRWYTILKFNNMDFSFLKLIKYHYISTVFQIVLPSGVGADAAKAVMLFHKADKVKSVNSAMIARGMGLIVLLVLSSVGILVFKSEIIDKWKSLILGLTLFAFLTFLLLLNHRFNLFLRNVKWLNKIKIIKKIFNNFLDNMNAKMLISLFLSSLLIQFVTIITFFFIFLSINIHISLIKLLIFIPMLIFLTIIIPSISGIGTREYFLWYFFSTELAKKESLAALSVVNYTLLLTVVLVGIIFWFHSIITNRK